MRLERGRAAGHLTAWASRLYARLIDRRLAMIGVSSGYLPVFFALADGQALSQKALVEQAAIEQSTMAATLARMVRDGLVQRQPDPKDGRAVLFSLTPQALAKVPAIAETGAAANAEAMEGLTPEQAEAYRTTLRTIIGNLERVLAS
jgi:DNA-binding MarR family transcriptional regulator